MGLSKAVKNIIIINVIIFFITLFYKPVYNIFAMMPTQSNDFYVWQLFTYQFVHLDIWHILFNMLFLFFIGPIIELKYFRKSSRFFVFFVSCGFCVGLLSFIFQLNHNAVILGSSGSIFALLYPLWRYFGEEQIYFWGIIQMKLKYFVYIIVAIQIVMLFAYGNISALGHLFGIAVSIPIIYLYSNLFYYRKTKPTNSEIL